MIFINPESDPRDAGYNIIQSLIAVGSGSIIGQGYQKGPLTNGNFVPEQHTDFIFSSFAEEWGFLGVLLLIGCFFTISMRLFNMLSIVESQFEKLILTGVLTFITFHACVNIAMNISLLPVTGVPLPLMSYGGTAIWACLFSLGLVQRIYANNISTHMFR